MTKEILFRNHIEQSKENKTILDAFIKKMKKIHGGWLTEKNQGTFAEKLQKFLTNHDISVTVQDIIAKIMKEEK